MHKSIFIITLLISCFTCAQPPNYDDLKILYADANYSKLIKSAQSYINRKETKNDPVPHIWLANTYYKKSLIPNDENSWKTDYQRAADEFALSIQLDSNHRVIQDMYEDYVDRFKFALAEDIIYEIEAREPSIFWVSEYEKIKPNSPGIRFIRGYFDLINEDEAGAACFWEEADSLLSKTDFSDQSEMALSIKGLSLALPYYVKNGQREKAKLLLLKTVEYFKKDEGFRMLYEDVMEQKIP